MLARGLAAVVPAAVVGRRDAREERIFQMVLVCVSTSC